MSKLIQFQDADGKPIFINPDEISYLREKDGSIIFGINGQEIEIEESMEIVRKNLSGEYSEPSRIVID